MYTVFKINLDGNLSCKEHLNNFDEVNTWLYEVAYYQHANVKIINDQTKNFRDYTLVDDDWLIFNRGSGAK
jgi:hypothetical protein